MNVDEFTKKWQQDVGFDDGALTLDDLLVRNPFTHLHGPC